MLVENAERIRLTAISSATSWKAWRSTSSVMGSIAKRLFSKFMTEIQLGHRDCAQEGYSAQSSSGSTSLRGRRERVAQSNDAAQLLALGFHSLSGILAAVPSPTQPGRRPHRQRRRPS